jgi:hypothetical protein
MHHWLNTMRHVCFLDLDLLRVVVFRMSSVNVMKLYPIEDAFGLSLLFRLTIHLENQLIQLHLLHIDRQAQRHSRGQRGQGC